MIDLLNLLLWWTGAAVWGAIVVLGLMTAFSIFMDRRR